jgi:hypothetical protein
MDQSRLRTLLVDCPDLRPRPQPIITTALNLSSGLTRVHVVSSSASKRAPRWRCRFIGSSADLLRATVAGGSDLRPILSAIRGVSSIRQFIAVLTMAKGQSVLDHLHRDDISARPKHQLPRRLPPLKVPIRFLPTNH